MSALPRGSEVAVHRHYVRLVPIPDSCTAANSDQWTPRFQCAPDRGRAQSGARERRPARDAADEIRIRINLQTARPLGSDVPATLLANRREADGGTIVQERELPVAVALHHHGNDRLVGILAWPPCLSGAGRRSFFGMESSRTSPSQSVVVATSGLPIAVGSVGASMSDIGLQESITAPRRCTSARNAPNVLGTTPLLHPAATDAA